MKNNQLAIIGLSCRFPHAENEFDYWQLLESAGNGIDEIPPNRWRADEFYDKEMGLAGKMNTKWGGFLKDIDGFDASLFGVPSHEAARMDPQQRLSMELAWEALEDAGIFPPSLSGSETAVILGIAHNDHNRLLYRDLDTIDAYNGTNTYLSVAANRLSYALDLRGPSMAIDTACSSSLYAISVARSQLMSGRTDCALVGGVNINLSPEEFISLSHAGLMDGDGQCKTFDASADGYVRGEGGGFLVVRRLEDAIRDSNRIRAIICGEATNTNGRTFGLTAPRGEAQKALLKAAWENANLDVERLGMVEVNGTATLMGDRIELKALEDVLNKTDQDAKVFVGTAKTNVGHLEAASGMAGLIKVILSMQHATIPPHRNIVEFAKGLPLGKKLHVPLSCEPWPQEHQVFGGVSAFGFGGANAHVVLANRSNSETQADKNPNAEYASYALMLSAKTPSALKQRLLDLQSFVSEHTVKPGDLAKSLAASRANHQERLAITASQPDELLEKLAKVKFESIELRGARKRKGPKLAVIQNTSDAQGQSNRFADNNSNIEQLFNALGIKADRILSSQAQPAENSTPIENFLSEDRVIKSAGQWLLLDASEHMDSSIKAACTKIGIKYLGLPKEGMDCASTVSIMLECWLAGLNGNWANLWTDHTLISLPAYPFEHERYPRDPYTKIVSDSGSNKKPHLDQISKAAIEAQIIKSIKASVDEDITIDLDTSILNLGVDSLRIMALRGELAYRYGTVIDNSFQGDLSVRELAVKIMQSISHNGVQEDKASHSVEPANLSQGSFPELELLDARLETYNGSLPFFIPHDGINSATTNIHGRQYINFSSYNYVGLSGHPTVCEEVSRAIKQYGTSVSASRVVGGECHLHGLLESEISNFLGAEDSIVFVGGHATNVSVLGHLAGPDDFICFDELIHNSCFEGAMRSGARYQPFRHNDVENLKRIVAQSRSTCRRLFIVVEGVYSMDGDTVPLKELVDIAKRWDCVTMVDEAHSLGTIGKTGRGISEFCGVAASQVDIWMGTLSKSLGSCGGYIAGSKDLIRYLKYTCPGFVYSVGISPANTAAALTALSILRKEPERAQDLQEKATRLRSMFQVQGWDVGSSVEGTPIVPLIIGSEKRSMAVSKHLMEHGINVLPVLPPAVSEEGSRLRFFVTSEHSQEQLEMTLECLKMAMEVGVGS